MLRSDLPRASAFDTLRPAPPEILPADRAVTSELRLALALQPDSRIDQFAADGRPMPGKYVVEQGGRRIFVKQVTAAAYDNHVLADEIARHAASRGADAGCLLNGFPRKAADGGYFFAYPYVDHRYCAAEDKDIAALGEALARLHASLRDFSRIAEVRQFTAMRYKELERLKAGIDAQTRCNEGLPEDVYNCFRRYPFETDGLSGDDAQLIHGDLNYTNVCFPRDGRAPQFIDFETSPRSFLSPACDMAQVVDRFIMTAPKALWRGLFTAFSVGYARESGLTVSSGDRVLSLIKLLAMRSLLLLCLRHEAGETVAASEWRKFTETFVRVDSADESVFSER